MQCVKVSIPSDPIILYRFDILSNANRMMEKLDLEGVRALHDAFICGTAVVATPIDKKGREHGCVIADDEDGPFAGRLGAPPLEIQL